MWRIGRGGIGGAVWWRAGRGGSRALACAAGSVALGTPSGLEDSATSPAGRGGGCAAGSVGGGEGAEDGGGGAAALDGVVGGLGDLAEGFDGFFGDLFLPELAVEGAEVEERVQRFLDVGLLEPAGEGEEGEIVGGGERSGVGAAGERLEEELLRGRERR